MYPKWLLPFAIIAWFSFYSIVTKTFLSKYFIAESVVANHNDNSYDYKPYDNNSWFYPKLTVCIGVQKSGTSSLRSIFKKFNNIHMTQKEIHHFDSHILNSVDGHELDSFDLAIQSFYKSNKASVAKYIDFIQENDTKSMHYFTKTPQYCVYPHIAHIMVNEMVKYGTKILILLRDPIKRFISGFFSEKRNPRLINLWPETVHGIDEYLDETYNDTLHGNNSFAAFNSYLKHSYFDYLDDDNINNKKEMMMKVMNRYKEFVYFYTKEYLSINPNTMKRSQGFHKYYLIWIRSCYSPQILPWIYYINNLQNNERYMHQFKILQSEQFFDARKYEDIIQSIRCFVEYDIDNYRKYDEYMNECVSKKHSNDKEGEQVHRNSKAKAYNISRTTQHIEALSFEYCNKWLEVLLGEHPTLVLERFDWNLWTNVSVHVTE